MQHTKRKSSIGKGASEESEVMSTERSLSVAKLIWAGDTKYFDPYLPSLGAYQTYHMRLSPHRLIGMYLPNQKTMNIEKLS